MSGEAMARMVLKKVNGKKKFLYRQRRYQSYPLKRMLCNTLIQPYYDFACCSWYPNLSMSQKTKLQTTQCSCIRYCLGLKDSSHIGKNEFEKINWLPVSNRVGQSLAVLHTILRMLFRQNIWVICTTCEFLQTLGLVGQLTVLLYLIIKKKLLENQFLI